MTVLLPILAMAAAPAAAVGTVRSRDQDATDPVALRRWYEHGRCLVKKQGPLAEQMLATRPASLDAIEAFMHADKEPFCFNEGSAPAPLLHYNATRGAIVEALLLRDFSAVGKPRGTHVAAIVSMNASPKHGLEPVAPRVEAMLALAECVVKADPVGSFAVFSTEVAGPAEDAAVRSLTPAVGQCLPPGFEFTLKAPVLRSFLAEAAYRVSVQQPAEAPR
jgi:hypothetical protein